jgi:hypothetical protein
MRRHGLRPTPSMAVSVAALVVALGGTSYAVAQLPARSVGPKQLKRNAVTATNIKANAISSAKVKDNSLKGRDIDEASLSAVPLATRATTADSVARAGVANLAAGLERVVYRVSTVSLPQAPAPGESTEGEATARCDPGQLVVGGGVQLEQNAPMSVVDGFPNGAAAWTASANNDDVLAAHSFTVYAICIAATTPG